jgi:hypothetical protein
MGVNWWPWGAVPDRVQHGLDCPHDPDRVIVEGPEDRTANAAISYPPGRDWSLPSYAPDITNIMRTRTTVGAERKSKSQLSWSVRFGFE